MFIEGCFKNRAFIFEYFCIHRDMYGFALIVCAYASDNVKKRGCAVVNLEAV